MRCFVYILIGALCGVALGLFIHSDLNISSPKTTSGTNISQMAQIAIVLRQLRNRETDYATESLETMLDSDLLTLASVQKGGAKLNLSTNKSLQIVKQYRLDYPRHVSQDVDDLVAEILNQALPPKRATGINR